MTAVPEAGWLLLFGMLGFPDSIPPVTVVIIYEARKCISESGEQQRAVCPLLLPSFSTRSVVPSVTSPLLLYCAH